AALFIPHYILGAFDQETLSDTQTTIAAVAIVVAVTIARLVRRTNVYVAGGLLTLLGPLLQVGLGALGLLLPLGWTALKNNVDLGVAPTWSSLAFALPIAMIGFTGLEKVTSLAGLAKHPEKTVPDSVRTSVFTVILVYAAVATAATSAFPVHPDPN